MTAPLNLDDWFGAIDVYLFDQLLKQRIQPDDHLLDAGCGDGRNLTYFLRCGWSVAAADRSAAAVGSVRRLAARLAPHLPPENFRVEALDALSFSDAAFDVVICSAVLHFSDDESHFERIMRELWRVLRPGGVLFARTASSIGIEARLVSTGPRHWRSPDGVERFLVDEPMLTAWAGHQGGDLLDPLKTTIVHDQRSMTTWVLRKRSD